jgi:hypothetical protein
MKPTTYTKTTFTRFSARNQTRQTVTVLFLYTGSALCAVETTAPDGRDIPDYLVMIAKRGIPRGIIACIYGQYNIQGD